ncbi:MAG: 30S ribosomal protein S16 [Acidobacteriota bacterium]
MLKIRLRRMGSRHRPFYRVVVSDSRRTPTAAALEVVGYYDPRKQPVTLKLDVDRVDHWINNGAQPSKVVKKLVAQARATANDEPATEAAAAEDAAAEDTVAEAEVAAEAAEEATAEASSDDDSAEAEATAEDAPEATEATDDEAKA